MAEKRITIYTDGSCSPNPGRGGWAYIAVVDDVEICDAGRDNNTTNNKMELTAVIEAIKAFSLEKNFRIYSDSQLTIRCALGTWRRNKNLHLWKQYDKYSKDKDIKFTWVKAHNGDRYNELVDQLAKKCATGKSEK